jgi:hypothetical protein
MYSKQEGFTVTPSNCSASRLLNKPRIQGGEAELAARAADTSSCSACQIQTRSPRDSFIVVLTVPPCRRAMV